MDSTKKKQLETFLYSAIGIAAVALILIAVNLIAGTARQRVDLTAENAYTLSPGTRAILAKLDTPIQIRFYCTKNASAMPVFLKTYAQRVEDLLGEYRQASKGRIEIQKLESRAGFRCGGFSPARWRRRPADSERRKSLSRLERRHARSEAGDSVPDARSRTPPRIRHFARDRARHDRGKTGHRSDESVAGHGRSEPDDANAAATAVTSPGRS